MIMVCLYYSVSSSEKVDKWARYADFQIASMPYPGKGDVYDIMHYPYIIMGMCTSQVSLLVVL